jgi:hypothetical protein
LIARLEAGIPPYALRCLEWGVGANHSLFATAILHGPLRKSYLHAILADGAVARRVRGEAMAILEIPCLRHMVRLDSEGGLSLYLERDCSPGFIRAFCTWFGIPPDFADEAWALIGPGFATITGLGLHWHHGQPRLRVYGVGDPARAVWTTMADTLTGFLSRHLDADGMATAAVLLARPRRCCLVNLEHMRGRMSAKIEIPDLSTAELPRFLPPGVRIPTLVQVHRHARRLRYVGVRLVRGEAPKATYYFPVSRSRLDVVH